MTESDIKCGLLCSSPIFTSELQIRSLDEASNTIRYCKNCGGLGRIVAKYMKRDTKATKTAIFSMRRKMNIKARTLVLPDKFDPVLDTHSNISKMVSRLPMLNNNNAIETFVSEFSDSHRSVYYEIRAVIRCREYIYIIMWLCPQPIDV